MIRWEKYDHKRTLEEVITEAEREVTSLKSMLGDLQREIKRLQEVKADRRGRKPTVGVSAGQNS